MKYQKNTAEFIVNLTGNSEYLEIRDDGVYVAQGFELAASMSPVASDLFLWNPECELERQHPDSAPVLPIPFQAHELAAFMLHGLGHGIIEHLGAIGELNEEVLQQSVGIRNKIDRRALQEAYEAADKAQEQAGEHDVIYANLVAANELLHKAEDANLLANEREGVWERGITEEERTKRRERAKASVTELSVQAAKTKQDADNSEREWRRAMVLRLFHNAGSALVKHVQPRWEDRAREIGERIKKQKPRLSQMQIAYKVESELEAEGITGRGGKKLTAENIRRGALNGL
jgi:hypothetical protein